MEFRLTAGLLGVVIAAQVGIGQEDKELPVLVRSFAEVKKPAPGFEDGVFDPRKGETIAFLGGTDTFNQQRSGFLEARFHLAWPDRELRFRNLGWQGDTIFYQARPRFFYTKEGDPQPQSSPDIRERTRPEIIFIQFGKLESLDGEPGLPKFLAAYGKLLDGLQEKTNRLVLVGPTPFFPAGPAAGLAESRNKMLRKVSDEIRRLAEERGLLFVNGLSLAPEAKFSTNGTHLNEEGQAAFALLVALELKFPLIEISGVDSPALQSLHQSIQRKNRLWHQYYHPTNWAFLFGDRQHVPASRDHIDTNKRWFIKEIESLPPLISETEEDIHRYAREVRK